MCSWRLPFHFVLWSHSGHWNVPPLWIDLMCVWRDTLNLALEGFTFVNWLDVYLKMAFLLCFVIAVRTRKFSCRFICRLTLVTLWFSKNTKFNVHLKIAFSFCLEITVWTWDCFTFMNSFDVHLKIIFPSRFVITVWTWECGRCFSLWLMWFDVCHITGPLSGFEITTLTLKCFTLMLMIIWVS